MSNKCPILILDFCSSSFTRLACWFLSCGGAGVRWLCQSQMFVRRNTWLICLMKVYSSGLWSGVNMKSEEFFWMMAIESTEVRKTEQELGKQRAVIWSSLCNKRAKSTYQILLKLFYSPHVWNTWTIWQKQNREKRSLSLPC